MGKRFCACVFVALVMAGLMGMVSANYTFGDDHGKNAFDDDVDSFKNAFDLIGLRFNIYDGYLAALKTVMQQDANAMYSDARVENGILYIYIVPAGGSSHAVQGAITLAFAGFVQAVNLTDINSLIYTWVDKNQGFEVATYHANAALAQHSLHNLNNSTEIAIDIKKFADTMT